MLVFFNCWQLAKAKSCARKAAGAALSWRVPFAGEGGQNFPVLRRRGRAAQLHPSPENRTSAMPPSAAGEGTQEPGTDVHGVCQERFLLG